MADLKITALGAAAALDGSELVEAVQGGVNVKTTTADIAALGGSLPVRNDVTIANGVTTINWAAGDIQNLTITEAKVFNAITNPVVGETIVLVVPGTNAVSFTTINASIHGQYKAGEENRIFIYCIKVSGGAEFLITFDNTIYTGLPVGGTTGQVLSKINNDDYNTQWVTGGGGSGDVLSSTFAFSALTDGATVSWSVGADEVVSNRTLALGGNRTFGAPTGMSSGFSGNVLTTASGANRTINIPAGATHKLKGVGNDAEKVISILSGQTFIISWLYDGTNWWWWYVDQ